MYETCKSATLITSFNRFGLCTSYHTAMTSFTHYNGCLRSRKSNVTVTVLFQPAKPNESETTIQHGEKSFKVDHKCQELQKLCKPAKKPDLPANYQVPTDPIPVNNDLLDAVRAKGVAWLLVRLDLDVDPLYTVKIRLPNQTMPSWSAKSSVCSPDGINRKRIAFLSILPYPVTQYDIVYTAMKNLCAT